MRDGFLGRCIIVESKRPRQLTKFTEKTEPPADIVEWCRAVHYRNVVKGDIDQLCIAEMEATRILLPFSDGCAELLREVEIAMNEAKNDAEKDGLDMLLGRTIEKSMRLAMIVAKARDAYAKEISIADLQWAIEYIKHYDLALVKAARENRSVGEFDTDTKKVIELIKNAKRYTADKKYAAALKAGFMPRGKLQKLVKKPPKYLKDLVEAALDEGTIIKADLAAAIDYGLVGEMFRYAE